MYKLEITRCDAVSRSRIVAEPVRTHYAGAILAPAHDSPSLGGTRADCPPVCHRRREEWMRRLYWQ
jgi:hypothetical protein